MENNVQTPTEPLNPQMSSTPMLSPVSGGSNNMVILLLVVAAAIVAGVFWWWMGSSDQWAEPYPTPTPTVQDEELKDLNSIDTGDIDSEFKAIDQEVNSL